MADVKLVATDRLSVARKNSREVDIVEAGGEFTVDSELAESLQDRGLAAKPGTKDAKAATTED